MSRGVFQLSGPSQALRVSESENGQQLERVLKMCGELSDARIGAGAGWAPFLAGDSLTPQNLLLGWFYFRLPVGVVTWCSFLFTNCKLQGCGF